MSLKDLSEARGVPGREASVRALLLELTRPYADEVRTDAMGNLYVGKGLGRPGPTLALFAHMDEVGFLVTGHDEDGRLNFRPSGGIDPRVVAGKPVLVGDGDPIPGVVALPPAHLTRQRERRVLGYEDLAIDIGAETAAEARAIAPLGSMVTFATPFVETTTHVIGKALDDRAGCHLAAQAFAEPVGFPLWVVFTAQEETGLRGAKVAARRLRPDAALVLEGTPAADTAEGARGRELTRVGDGPALTILDHATVPDRRLTEGLLAAARAADVPWQWRRGRGGGTDAGALWPEGIPVATVSLPCRYIHAPAAVAAKSDLEAIGRLVPAFLALFPEVMGDVG